MHTQRSRAGIHHTLYKHPKRQSHLYSSVAKPAFPLPKRVVSITTPRHSPSFHTSTATVPPIDVEPVQPISRYPVLDRAQTSQSVTPRTDTSVPQSVIERLYTDSSRKQNQQLVCTIFTPTRPLLELLPVDYVSFTAAANGMSSETLIFRGYSGEFSNTYTIAPGMVSFQPAPHALHLMLKQPPIDQGISSTDINASANTAHKYAHQFFTSGGIAVKNNNRVILSLVDCVDVAHLDYDKVQNFIQNTQTSSHHVISTFYKKYRNNNDPISFQNNTDIQYPSIQSALNPKQVGTDSESDNETKKARIPEISPGFKYLMNDAEPYVVAQYQDVAVALDRLYRNANWLLENTNLDLGLSPEQQAHLDQTNMANITDNRN